MSEDKFVTIDMSDVSDSQPLVLPPAILIAETYALARASLSDLFQHDGYRVFQAADRESAMSCIDKNLDLAVVLSDLDMPHWKSLLRHAKTFVPSALIMGMAGFHSLPGPEELQRRGIHVCLKKPLAFENVRQAIAHHAGINSKA